MRLRCHDGLGWLGTREIFAGSLPRQGTTRDPVWSAIYDYLYCDKTGPPTDSCTPDDVRVRADEVYQHVFQVYPTVPSPYYAVSVAAQRLGVQRVHLPQWFNDSEAVALGDLPSRGRRVWGVPRRDAN